MEQFIGKARPQADGLLLDAGTGRQTPAACRSRSRSPCPSPSRTGAKRSSCWLSSTPRPGLPPAVHGGGRHGRGIGAAAPGAVANRPRLARMKAARCWPPNRPSPWRQRLRYVKTHQGRRNAETTRTWISNATPKQGELVRVRAQIEHTMESGLRTDAAGQIRPRNIVTRFEARLGPTLLLAWGRASRSRPTRTSSSPFWRAKRRLHLLWKDDAGQTLSAQKTITLG